MQALEEKSVDVVVTSPPYNLGISYATYQDRHPTDVYLTWCEAWLRAIQRVMVEDGALFLNVGASNEQPFLPHELLLRARDVGFRLQNTIHWVKSISIEERDGRVISRGHFKPLNSGYHLNGCHEYVFHLTRSGRVPINRRAVGVPYADKSNVRRWAHTGGQDLRCRGNTWFVPYETIHRRATQRPHPATFPVELAVKCLRLHGANGRRVMDPFLGIGSTAVAAWRVGAAEFVGFEIDEEYAELARARLSAERGSSA